MRRQRITPTPGNVLNRINGGSRDIAWLLGRGPAAGDNAQDAPYGIRPISGNLAVYGAVGPCVHFDTPPSGYLPRSEQVTGPEWPMWSRAHLPNGYLAVGGQIREYWKPWYRDRVRRTVSFSAVFAAFYYDPGLGYPVQQGVFWKAEVLTMAGDLIAAIIPPGGAPRTIPPWANVPFATPYGVFGYHASDSVEIFSEFASPGTWLPPFSTTYRVKLYWSGWNYTGSFWVDGTTSGVGTVSESLMKINDALTGTFVFTATAGTLLGSGAEPHLVAYPILSQDGTVTEPGALGWYDPAYLDVAPPT